MIQTRFLRPTQFISSFTFQDKSYALIRTQRSLYNQSPIESMYTYTVHVDIPSTDPMGYSITQGSHHQQWVWSTSLLSAFCAPKDLDDSEEVENCYVGKSVQLVDRVFCLVEFLYEVGFGRVFLWLDCISFCVCAVMFSFQWDKWQHSQEWRFQMLFTLSQEDDEQPSADASWNEAETGWRSLNKKQRTDTIPSTKHTVFQTQNAVVSSWHGNKNSVIRQQNVHVVEKAVGTLQELVMNIFRILNNALNGKTQLFNWKRSWHTLGKSLKKHTPFELIME